MRSFFNILFLLAGLAAALACYSMLAIFDGWPRSLNLPVVLVVLAIFLLAEDRALALALGAGLGFDLASGYPFFAWTAVMLATFLVCFWLSRSFLTNRSLPSLLMLGAAAPIAFVIFEAGLSRALAAVGGTVWFSFAGVSVLSLLVSMALELGLLTVIFIIYLRFRGERSRMLTHL